jgi:hypothetical protein
MSVGRRSKAECGWRGASHLQARAPALPTQPSRCQNRFGRLPRRLVSPKPSDGGRLCDGGSSKFSKNTARERHTDLEYHRFVGNQIQNYWQGDLARPHPGLLPQEKEWPADDSEFADACPASPSRPFPRERRMISPSPRRAGALAKADGGEGRGEDERIE